MIGVVYFRIEGVKTVLVCVHRCATEMIVVGEKHSM